MECGWKCKSRKHAYLLNCAITKCSQEDAIKYLNTCHASGVQADWEGKTAWHISAACGKRVILQHLVETGKGDINRTDKESGWTPLHTAVFHGQLECARYLISAKASLKIRDNEGLTPMDILTKDITDLLRDGYGQSDAMDVYTWGTNASFNLGHQGEQGRSFPTVVEHFRRKGIHFQKVAMAKYHTAMLTTDGSIYMCGHGRGGRLGLRDHNPTVEPKNVDPSSQIIWKDVCAARDHTLFLSEKGAVYGCGANDHYQLDQADPAACWTEPKLVNKKPLSGAQAAAVCAGRYHSLIQYRGSVKTFGLNAGQLGYGKGDSCHQCVPRVVSALSRSSQTISAATCSDAASVVVVQQARYSLIFLLYKYECRKVKSSHRFESIRSISVQGGQLDHLVAPSSLKDKGGSDLVLAVCNHVGQVFIWREVSSEDLVECMWTIRRPIWVTDIYLSPSDLVFVTKEGQVYSSALSSLKEDRVSFSLHANDYRTVKGQTTHDHMQVAPGRAVCRLAARPLAGAHRAVTITGDRKGYNYALLQDKSRWLKFSMSNPMLIPQRHQSSLYDFLQSADEYDGISDITLVVEGRTIPAHRYYLCTRSEYFARAVKPASICAEEGSGNGQLVLPADLTWEQVMNGILRWIYSEEWPAALSHERFEQEGGQESSGV